MSNTTDDSIQTKCPACGWRSLFVGAGGYLTCGNITDCPEPVFDDALAALIHRTQVESRIDELGLIVWPYDLVPYYRVRIKTLKAALEKQA